MPRYETEFRDFIGGLNTISANDSLQDNEFRELKNIDLGSRGSIKRRHGMERYITPVTEGMGQGFFRLYRKEASTLVLFAVQGQLYSYDEDTDTTTPLTIEGLTGGFQTTRPIEAVQYQGSLFIATGTKLVEFDGTTAKVVTPKKPDPLEALYIGTNALADDPDNYLSDGIANQLRIDGVTADKKKGVVHQVSNIEAFISKPEAMGTIEFKFMYRQVGDDTWEMGQDWSTERIWAFEPDYISDYEFDVYAREQATPTNEARFIVPKYTVLESDENEDVDFTAIHRCNRIVLHWERLILYNDDVTSGFIFVSHLREPSFFPTPNTLQFENRESDPITALVRYRDMLVAFTKGSVQALFGKSPDEYQRVILNTGVGCIAPYSAKVITNYIGFLSKDGVYVLNDVGYTQEKINVTKIDKNVENLIEPDEFACAAVNDLQYHLVFPSQNMRMRFYYEQNGVWTKDESEHLDFIMLKEWDGLIYGQSKTTGIIRRFNKSVFDDDGYVYEDLITTKEYDFGMPYDNKKLKEVVLLYETQNVEVSQFINVYADSNPVFTPKTSEVSIVDDEVVVTETEEPNLNIRPGTVLGIWNMGNDPFGRVDSQTYKLRVSGKCRRAHLVFSHRQSSPNRLLGFGFTFVATKGANSHLKG